MSTPRKANLKKIRKLAHKRSNHRRMEKKLLKLQRPAEIALHLMGREVSQS